MLWRRRLLLFVRLNAVLQSSYDLLNNHKVLIVIETFLFTSLMFFVEYLLQCHNKKMQCKLRKNYKDEYILLRYLGSMLLSLTLIS